MLFTDSFPSPVGLITCASDGESLIGLWIQGQKHFFSTLRESPTVCPSLPPLAQAQDWLRRYFAGARPSADELKLSPTGTAFQQAVWAMLLEIPAGQVTTYGALAGRMAQKTGKLRMSAQAIGSAVARNPISIIIPCHRVVGTGGNLTGYAGGIDIKLALLRHEGADVSRLFAPDRPTRADTSQFPHQPR